MPWKLAETRREHRKKEYSVKVANGYKRDWGKITAVCPCCEKDRLITKNTHGITKLPKDDSGRVVRRCRSCSRKNPNAKSHHISIIIDKHRKKRMQLKIKAVGYLGSQCMSCGYAYNGKNAYAFDFHHRDPSEKDFLPVSKNYGWERCRAELDKCDLLCAICHRSKHSDEY